MEKHANKDIFEGQWNQLKGSVKETWGDLRDDDLEKINGKKDHLVGLIQKTYGEKKESIEEILNSLLKKLH